MIERITFRRDVEEYGQRLCQVADAMGQAFADGVRSELRRMGHLV